MGTEGKILLLLASSISSSSWLLIWSKFWIQVFKAKVPFVRRIGTASVPLWLSSHLGLASSFWFSPTFQKLATKLDSYVEPSLSSTPIYYSRRSARQTYVLYCCVCGGEILCIPSSFICHHDPLEITCEWFSMSQKRAKAACNKVNK